MGNEQNTYLNEVAQKDTDDKMAYVSCHLPDDAYKSIISTFEASKAIAVGAQVNHFKLKMLTKDVDDIILPDLCLSYDKNQIVVVVPEMSLYRLKLVFGLLYKNVL